MNRAILALHWYNTGVRDWNTEMLAFSYARLCGYLSTQKMYSRAIGTVLPPMLDTSKVCYILNAINRILQIMRLQSAAWNVFKATSPWSVSPTASSLLLRLNCSCVCMRSGVGDCYAMMYSELEYVLVEKEVTDAHRRREDKDVDGSAWHWSKISVGEYGVSYRVRS